jgi:hypothetical protein
MKIYLDKIQDELCTPSHINYLTQEYYKNPDICVDLAYLGYEAIYKNKSWKHVKVYNMPEYILFQMSVVPELQSLKIKRFWKKKQKTIITAR